MKPVKPITEWAQGEYAPASSHSDPAAFRERMRKRLVQTYIKQFVSAPRLGLDRGSPNDAA